MRHPRLADVALACLLGLAASATSDAQAAGPGVAVPVRDLHPDGASMLRLLGSHAESTFAPGSGQIGALVAVPPGQTAASMGLEPVTDGIGRLRTSALNIDAWAKAHPGAHLEVSPPLHMLLERATYWTRAGLARGNYGVDGTGVIVGVADTGLDVSHPSLRDENGKTRVAWMLDLSLKPIGLHPELEDKFGVKDKDGKVTAGAVLSASDIDALLDRNSRAPEDEVGHGTHVTSIAAGGGTGGYVGMAPKATIVAVRVTRSNVDGIENDDLLRGVQFLFNRGDEMKMPIVANLSLGGDFGPHDGTMLWERTIASFVGPEHPGRAIVVAAGNSGSIAEHAVHQSVRVSAGTKMRVPIATRGASDGGVQVWVTLRSGAKVSVGLDGTDGTWISPIGEGEQAGRNQDGYNAGVIFGSGVSGSPVPQGTRGAVVLWSGAWPSGIYWVTFEGEGTVDMWMQTTGDVGGVSHPASFAAGVREGTINLPATSPSLIAVGCTINRPRWTSIAHGQVALQVPVLDTAGGRVDRSAAGREVTEGEMCWFSSAGPTVTGVPKPEISAPGAAVIAAMSRQAAPGGHGIFTTTSCPTASKTQAADPRCFQVDDDHAVAVGTSMSAPMVSGAVALLFQRDPTLTQDKITALLQAGAHPFRGLAPYQDQGGPGELDIVGTLDALDQMHTPALYLPSAAKSWITLSADYASADASTAITAIIELRTEDGQHRADFFDARRLQPFATIDGQPVATLPTIMRRGPGVYSYEFVPPQGSGGSSLTLGATFDGNLIVATKTIPVGADIWTANYPSYGRGGCSCDVVGTRGPVGRGRSLLALALGLAAIVTLRARSRATRSSRVAPTRRRRDRPEKPGRPR
jgi:subtilisin family serine protease